MKYLNLGCGYHYSREKMWVNLDFMATGEGMTTHNLLQGIPFHDNSFDLVYQSHVLEHFSKTDGLKLLKECHRTLKRGGILRIAVPDLEQIAKAYLHFLEKGIESPGNEVIRANYNWMLLELYDQTVRNFSGGEMGKYLCQNEILNEDFVNERIGEEGRLLRINYLRAHETSTASRRSWKGAIKSSIETIRQALQSATKATAYEKIGRFRLQGEIHQWMYDRYSLSDILYHLGFDQIIVRDAFASYVSNWADFELDGKHGIVRKPDSLFIEAIKK